MISKVGLRTWKRMRKTTNTGKVNSNLIARLQEEDKVKEANLR
jgi:hypothetical protein